MENKYRYTKTTVSVINYHFIFHSRYRRKIFLNYLQTQSMSKIMHLIKVYIGRFLRKEFKQLSQMTNLWTRNYFCSSAGDLCSEIIIKYTEN